ncbi:MAG: hypothetical protein N2112_12060 [Gemmataceae bacterium]|jgi:photosystem II stability/assembly factor-like uncharacterized protein|nr:hypothetical protein [Gemmataceae bacterium]
MPKSIFVCVGQDGLRSVSEDGQTWSKPQMGKEGETYRAVAFGNGRCVAVGSYGGGNIFAYTSDGEKWQTHFQDAKYIKYVRGFGFGKDQFVCLGGEPVSVGAAKPFVMFTKNGETLTEPRDIVGKHMLRRFAYGNNLYVAVGDRGRRSYSKDASEWVDVPETKAIDTLIDVTYGQGVFVGVGLHGLRMLTVDGKTWSHRQVGEEGEHLNSIVFAKDRFVAVGPSVTYFSKDGKTWTSQANKNAPTFFCYGNGKFLGIAWKGKILFSDDALTWKEVAKFDQHIEAIAWGAF